VDNWASVHVSDCMQFVNGIMAESLQLVYSSEKVSGSNHMSKVFAGYVVCTF